MFLVPVIAFVKGGDIKTELSYIVNELFKVFEALNTVMPITSLGPGASRGYLFDSVVTEETRGKRRWLNILKIKCSGK